MELQQWFSTGPVSGRHNEVTTQRESEKLLLMKCTFGWKDGGMKQLQAPRWRCGGNGTPWDYTPVLLILRSGMGQVEGVMGEEPEGGGSVGIREAVIERRYC